MFPENSPVRCSPWLPNLTCGKSEVAERVNGTEMATGSFKSVKQGRVTPYDRKVVFLALLAGYTQDTNAGTSLSPGTVNIVRLVVSENVYSPCVTV